MERTSPPSHLRWGSAFRRSNIWGRCYCAHPYVRTHEGCFRRAFILSIPTTTLFGCSTTINNSNVGAYACAHTDTNWTYGMSVDRSRFGPIGGIISRLLTPSYGSWTAPIGFASRTVVRNWPIYCPKSDWSVQHCWFLRTNRFVILFVVSRRFLVPIKTLRV